MFKVCFTKKQAMNKFAIKSVKSQSRNPCRNSPASKLIFLFNFIRWQKTPDLLDGIFLKGFTTLFINIF